MQTATMVITTKATAFSACGRCLLIYDAADFLILYYLDIGNRTRFNCFGFTGNKRAAYSTDRA